MDIAAILLSTFGIYLLCGLLFAVPFALAGVKRIDPHAAHGSWGFRVLIIPGTMFFWPLLATRWLKGLHQPPEENNAHRCAARNSRSSRSEEAQIESEIRNPKSEMDRSLIASAAMGGVEGAAP